MQIWVDFFQKYWEFARLHIIVLAEVFLLLALVIRQVRIAFFILAFGLFLSLAYYFMNHCESLGVSLDQALIVVILGALVAATVIYYFVFVRD